MNAIRIQRVSIVFLLVALSAVYLFPFAMTLSNALNELMRLPVIIPKEIHWENFYKAVTYIDYWKYMRNSFILCAIGMISTFTSGLTGYAFARLKGPGKKVLFMLVLSTMMLPAIVTQIPTYILIKQLGMTNTFWPWVIWAAGGSPFFIFLFRQFFSAIPKEIEEAAFIDGCSFLRIYFTIFIPLSVSAIATVSILNFQWNWNDWMTPFMLLKEEHYPLAAALPNIHYTMPGGPQNIILIPVQLASNLIYIVPVVLSFFLGQKYLVEGIVSSGVKG